MRFICSLMLGASLLFGPAALSQAQDAKDDAKHEGDHHKVDMPTQGVVVLVPTKGNKVRGVLHLMQKGEELRVTGTVRNLSPGEHGFHIHEFGDQRGSDGTAAGGHFNPGGHEHGAPGEKSHMGDLGNITADENGVAKVDMTAKGTPLHFVLGRSFVVHAGRDDLSSQPSGDAGARVATGVIGVANPEVVDEPADQAERTK